MLPTSPVPVALAALLAGLATARVLRSDLPSPAGFWRSVAVHALPAVATATVAVVVWTTPVEVWAWAAAGNPLTGTVAVSAGALAALPPQAVAALVAHERAHLERHHALFRAGTSAAVLAAGIGLLAAAFARRTEFAADGAAARWRSPRAVLSLLSSLPTISRDRSLPRRALSTHPSRERRLSAIREQFDVDSPTTQPANRRAYPGVDPTGGMNREGLAYGLLFSVPPAIGMTGFSVMATGGGLINPVAALIGTATFGIIFTFVYVAATRGQANENRSPGTI